MSLTPKSSKSKSPGNSSKSKVLVATTKSFTDASPRPGGFVKILPYADYVANVSVHKTAPASNACTCDISACQQGTQTARGIPKLIVTPPTLTGSQVETVRSNDTTRDYRIAKAIEESDWDISTIHEDDDDDHIDETNPIIHQKTPVNLIAVLISTVMMLASGNNLSNEYIDGSLSYLACVTDDENNIPPNIQSLFNHIEMLTGRTPRRSKGKDKSCAIENSNSNSKNYTVLTTEKASKHSIE